MERIVVDVSLTMEDAIEFQKAHYSKLMSPAMRYSIILIIGILFLANVVIDIKSGVYISIAAVLLGIILLVLILTPIMFRFSAKKAFLNNEILKKPKTHILTELTVSSKSEFGEISTKWDQMYEFYESKNSFLFYTGRNQAFIVPKRCLDNDEVKMDVIRGWAKAVPKNKKTGLFKISMMVTMGLAVIMFVIMMLIVLK